jgi:hypothetical protein
VACPSFQLALRYAHSRPNLDYASRFSKTHGVDERITERLRVGSVKYADKRCCQVRRVGQIKDRQLRYFDHIDLQSYMISLHVRI